MMDTSILRAKVEQENYMLEQYEGQFILVLSERDIKHPQSGGAEKYLHNALQLIAKEKKIVHLSTYYKGAIEEEIIDNIHYIRAGNNSVSVIFKGRKIYKKNKDNILAVIDHSNSHQFFTFLWAKKKRIFFTHQLTLDIWAYYYGFMGHILKFLEERLLRLSRGTAITVSPSTEKDLKDRGFEDIYVCQEGNDIILEELPSMAIKEDYLLYVGRLLPYKRVEDVILLAKSLNRHVKIMGRGPARYINKLMELVKEEKVDCHFTGFVSKEEKIEIMKKAYMLVLPSIREGWGLVITESANLGTPSLVYPVNGVVDAVDHGAAGFIAKEVGVSAFEEVVATMIPEAYMEKREKAFEYSLQFTWEKTAIQFRDTINHILEDRDKI